MAALACAIVREDQWFLSGFWTDPALRLHGVGGPLLREVRDEGRRVGARTFFVWSSPDFPAIASYLKLGMLPGTQLFAFAGPLARPPAAAAGYRVAPLAPEEAGRIDGVIRGVERLEDHRTWLSQPANRGALVTRGGDAVGYYYVHDGQIGAAGWTADEHGTSVLALALRDAAASGAEVQLVAPGTNHLAIRVALDAGLRLIRTSHLLWTAPVGRMERYLPSGPLLF